MPAGTGPSGIATPPPGSSRTEQIAIYEADFAEQYGTQAGNAYLTLATRNPQYTPLQLADLYATVIATHGLAGGIAIAIHSTGQSLNQIAAGSVAGGNAVEKSPIGQATRALSAPLGGLAGIGDFFGRLTEASTWVRVAEVGIGIAVLIVVIDKLSAGTPVGNAAHTAAKVALLA